MTQILRAFLHYQVGQGTPGPASESGVTLVYAAERQYDLCFTQLLSDIREKHPEFFNYYVVLVSPLSVLMGMIDAQSCGGLVGKRSWSRH
jgi:ferredoxin-NADP reductase